MDILNILALSGLVVSVGAMLLNVAVGISIGKLEDKEEK
jgi:hypothetical protein